MTLIEDIGYSLFSNEIADVIATAIIALIIFLGGYIHWWWINAGGRWMISTITFWPPNLIAGIKMGLEEEVPENPRFLAITIKLTLKVFRIPMIVEDATLTLSENKNAGENSVMHLWLYGYYDNNPKAEGRLFIEKKSTGESIIVEKGSEQKRELVFLPISPEGKTDTFGKLSPREYEMQLTLERTRGKPRRFDFTFPLTEGDIRDFQKDISLMVMNRNIRMLKKWYQFWK